MAARNDVTGDQIKSKAPTQKFRDGWELAFGKKKDKGAGEVSTQVKAEGNS